MHMTAYHAKYLAHELTKRCIRAALLEHFRDHAAVLIATGAAAEGINLRFCNLVVN